MIARIFPFVVILIAVTLFFGYVNPAYTGSVATLQEEIGGYERALAAAQAFAAKENALLAERNAIPAEGITRLEAFLPDGVDNVQLILDLDALATRSGVKLSNFEMDNAEEPGSSAEAGLPLEAQGPVETLSLGVSATGTYEAFRTFLAGVENSLRPLDLASMDISDSDTGVYTYDMLFTIYWLR